MAFRGPTRNAGVGSQASLWCQSRAASAQWWGQVRYCARLCVRSRPWHQQKYAKIWEARENRRRWGDECKKWWTADADLARNRSFIRSSRVAKRDETIGLRVSSRRSPAVTTTVVMCLKHRLFLLAGTYGTVFKAKNRETHEIVALKRVRLDDDDEVSSACAIIPLYFRLRHH